MPSSVTRAVTILMLALAAASPLRAAEYELTDIPSSAAKTDKELWRKVMAGFYGKYDKAHKCWISRSDGADYCMRPHTLHRVSDGAATLYFLVVGGNTLGGDNECHACTGVLGLLVLSDARPQLAIVARGPRFMAYGSWGRIPPEENFTIHRLGQPANFAWTVEGSWTGQGITVSWTDILGLIGGEVRSLGHLPRSFSDAGNCDNGVNMMTQEKCSEVEFDTLFETAKTGQPFASITLKGSGTLKGEPFTASYAVDFDSKAMLYPTPAGLPQEIQP